MIGYLRGKVQEQAEGRLLVVIPTGGSDETAGAVGYSVTVPQSAAYGLVQGKWIELFVYTHVREDALDLYGFFSRTEKDLFLTLLSVTGIGPKGAIGIVSGAEPSQVIQAIIERDKDFLTRVPGIGKKTAERVVLELADPLRKKVDAGLFGDWNAVQNSSRRISTVASGDRDSTSHTGALGQMVRDAKTALVGLGYREQDIASLLNRLAAEMNPPPSKVEDLIRVALRQLA
ncbi:MAG: Holliday junction DNA helicase RuvA [Bdellovibrionales bacterium RIFOXYC1_FULL_54_43]|nr:MAG: Holliday junction DNA helicase RuvA [Bdellovibrionales bacterium RIFOXYC1_FULL_54_43]OFZ83214.1 MAG: Holliday junction DNA helicase RuvA [Bdellovibrionales bacterium RIFOXYD1_FULL_55_31]